MFKHRAFFKFFLTINLFLLISLLARHAHKNLHGPLFTSVRIAIHLF